MAEPKRGRPRLNADDRTVPVSLGIPAKQYEDLCRQAKREAVSVPQLIRQAIQKTVQS